MSKKLALTIFSAFSIALSYGGATNIQAAIDEMPPEVINTVLSTNTVAYQGSSVPGYVTFTLNTDEPTRGYILAVREDGRQAKINLSTTDFKTQHVVHWAPWDDTKKEPLPAGTYRLKSYLSDAAYNSAQGFPIGQITIVNEVSPKALVTITSLSNNTISPTYAANKVLTTLQYELNRPSEVQIEIQKDGVTHFKTEKKKLDAGLHSFDWNGKNEKGSLLRDGEYDIVFKTIELAYNYPAFSQTIQKIGKITIANGESEIPQWKLQEIVSGGFFDAETLDNNGSVSGKFTMTEAAKVTVYIATEAGSHVNSVYTSSQELQPGTYSFTWDGKNMMDSKAINGNYYMKLSVLDSSGSHGYFTVGSPVTITNHTAILPLHPEKQVKVITDSTQMSIYPMDQGYTAKKGETMSLVSNTIENGYYSVLVKGVPGKVKAADVEVVGSSSPEPTSTSPTEPVVTKETASYTVVSGDTLWKIAQKNNTTINELVELNQLDINKALNIGQVLQVPVPNTVPQPQTSQVIHEVQAGDTLWKVSQTYGVTVDAILTANKLSASNYLFIGQKLIIPVQETLPELTPVTHNVQAGDTLWKISQTYGVTINELLTANKLDANNYLYIGQKLVIPSKQLSYKMYTVQSGDSLWKIAQLNQVTIQHIVDLNGLNVNHPINVGQQLKI